MNIFVLLLQIFFTIPLFVILEYLKSKNIKEEKEILIPTIYILILSGLELGIKENIYLIVIFEVLLHNFYIKNILKRDMLTDLKDNLVSSFTKIIVAIFTYYVFINQVDTVFPNALEMRPFIWVFIMMFIYSLMKDNINYECFKDKDIKRQMKEEYIITNYAKIKNKFYYLLNDYDRELKRLIYSILVYENYKKPYFFREFEKIMNRFNKKKIKYGIAQVESLEEINDEESILLLIDMFKDKLKNKNFSKLLKVKYNEEEIDIIMNIINKIESFDQK